VTERDIGQPHAVVATLENLHKALESEEFNENDILQNLKTLTEECKIDLAHRILAEKNGAFDIILKSVKKFSSNPIIIDQCLLSMASLTDGYPDILTHDGAEFLTGLLDKECPISTIDITLNIVSNCCKMHERNRESFVTRFQLGAQIKKILGTHPTKSDSQVGSSPDFKYFYNHINILQIIVKCCQLIRAIVADDDVRVEFGRAHEYACIIADQENGLEVLTSLLIELKENHEVVKEILLTLSRLAVRNEFCQRVVELGGLKFVMEVMIHHYDDKELAEKSFFLIKALAGNDDVKREVAKIGGIPLIVTTLDRHKSVPMIAEMGCAAIAALCLRVPENAEAFVVNSVAPLLIDMLKNHRLKVSVERQASMAIRNMVSRRKELAPAFLEAGAEELLQNAIKRSQRAPTNEIKAALRDLGCKIHLQELWTGTGPSVTN